MKTTVDLKAKAEAIVRKLGGGWKIRLYDVCGSYDLELAKGKVRLRCSNFPGREWDAFHVSEEYEIPNKLFRTPYAALGALRRRVDLQARRTAKFQCEVYFWGPAAR